MRFSSVGFSGSRALAGAEAVQVRRLASQAAQAGALVLVGCAAGADAAARAGAPSAVVFRAAGRRPRQLAARPAAFVQALAARPSAVLLSWPGRACPLGVLPAASWPGGFGSGSWASAALAAGLGVPVVVFLPVGVVPPSAWGSWSFLPSGTLAGGWRLVVPRLPRQRPLF